MSDTRSMVKGYVDDEVRHLRELMEARFDGLDAKFDGLRSEFAGVSAKVDALLQMYTPLIQMIREMKDDIGELKNSARKDKIGFAREPRAEYQAKPKGPRQH